MVYFAVIEVFGEGFVTKSPGFYDKKKRKSLDFRIVPSKNIYIIIPM